MEFKEEFKQRKDVFKEVFKYKYGDCPTLYFIPNNQGL